MELSIFCIFFGIFASSVTNILSYEEFMVATYHPGVMNDLLGMPQYKEQKMYKAFKRWQADLKSSVCRKVIDPVSFHVLDKTEDFTYGPVPNSVDNLLRRVDFTYAFGEMDAINYAVVNVNIENVIEEVEAHLCIVDPSYQVAIASGYHNDVYFCIYKTDKMDSFRVFGVAERKAIVHPLMNYNPMQLMTAYIDNLQKQIDKRQGLQTFCTLSEYRKFRLCSLAYVSFLEQRKTKLDKLNYTRAENGRVCVKKAKLLMEFKDKFYYLLTDLITCNIGTLSSTLRFYLIPDPHVRDSAYIVRKSRMNPKTPLHLGNFSGVNVHNIGFEKTQALVKNLKTSFASDRKTEDQQDGGARQTSEDKDFISGQSRQEEMVNQNVDDGPFYQLEMVLMKLTPLLDFDK